MATHNLLDKNVPVYHRFVDNQVLTNDQLNEVIDHINYQDKLTRAGLIGVGNVCGIVISKDGNDIIVSGGVAVTTDGDILKIRKTVFKGYKKFNDERVKYGHFLGGDDKILDLYELKEDNAPTNVKPLSAFNTDTSISDNKKVFILYLECYPKEEEDCSPLECNAQGEEVVRNVKVLVTSYENAKKIAAKDSIFSSFLNSSHENVAIDIPKIFVKRIVIDMVSGASISTLKNKYAQNFTNLSEAITRMGDISLFKKQLNQFPIDVKSFFNALTPTNTNFQYLYDFYKDLISAFNELADHLNEVYTICCPDPTAFPKHILRGGLVAQTDSLKHRFYASPIHDHKNSIESLKLMFQRLLEMIQNFSVSIKEEIRITPSRYHHFSLGERAIPFYYDLEKSSDPEILLSAWKLNDNSLLTNYYRANYPNLFGDPLDYCLDGHDFFRIEGHVGHNVISAMKDITEIRNLKGLGFDILPIAVGNRADEATLDYDKYKIYFEDLQIILQAWNEEIKCIVSGSSQFLSSFSLLNAGHHLQYMTKVVSDGGGAASPERASSLAIGNDIKSNISEISKGDYITYKGYTVSDKVNNVVENLATNEGSTGYYWNGVIDIEDNQNDIKVKFQDAVDEQVKDWLEDYKVGGIQIPADVLGALKDVEDDKLLDIEDFTDANLEKFIASLQKQCNTGKKAKKTLQDYVSKKDSLLKDQIYLEQYYFVLNNIISTCCMIERFRVLYEEILKRKQELLDCLVLKEFIKKHPSAEHKAGVKEGGTFIVLYYSKGNTKGFNDLGEAQILVKKGDTILDVLEHEVLNGNSSRAIGLKGELISDGTVIGDLCLPYICCSQIPATTFVFPDRETDLIISKEHVCIVPDSEADLVPVTPTPADGEVKAYVNGSEIEGAIQVKESKYFFDPNAVKTENYNREISFTVNGQNVTPTITCYLKPQPLFTFNGPTFSNENKRANIKIQNQSTEIDGQVFNWDFEVAQFENGLTDFDFNFVVQPGNRYSFSLKLTATNRQCSDTYELPLEFVVPEIKVDPETGLTIDKDFICHVFGSETDPIQIHPVPTDAEVVASISGKEIENGVVRLEDKTFFIPNALKPEFYNQTINFSVNGDLVESTFTVHEQPQPMFEISGDPEFSNDNTRLTINILNTSKVIDGQAFKWDMNGENLENNEEKFSHTFDVVPGEIFNIKIEMEAINNPCSNFADGVSFEINVPKTENNENEEFNCNDITLEKIKAGENRLLEFLEMNNNDIGTLKDLYTLRLGPLYKLIDDDLVKVMNGEHDTIFRNQISKLQSQISESYFNLQGPENRKEWLLRLYYEAILLYLSIQACRKSAINAFTKITGNWMPFTKRATAADRELVGSILDKVSYHKMLETLSAELSEFLSSTMKDLLKNIIELLKRTIG